MEIWKSIKGFEGYYEVSSIGRIRSVDRYVHSGIKHNNSRLVKGRMLKQSLKKNGYFSVDLSKDNKVKTMLVHRIVAINFIENPNNKKVVNHKNANKQDNRIENLEWVTDGENKDHAKKNDLYKGPGRKPIKCKQTGMCFESSYHAAEWLNTNVFNCTKNVKHVACKIRACVLGKQSIAYGYTWENI